MSVGSNTRLSGRRSIIRIVLSATWFRCRGNRALYRFVLFFWAEYRQVVKIRYCYNSFALVLRPSANGFGSYFSCRSWTLMCVLGLSSLTGFHNEVFIAICFRFWNQASIALQVILTMCTALACGASQNLALYARSILLNLIYNCHFYGVHLSIQEASFVSV